MQFVICDLFEQVTTALNEQAKKLANYDVEVSKLKTEVRMLKDQLTEKERELQAKEKELMDMKKSFPEELPPTQEDKAELETTEVLALKVGHIFRSLNTALMFSIF